MLAEDGDPKSLRKGQNGSMLRAAQTKASEQQVANVSELGQQRGAALQQPHSRDELIAGHQFAQSGSWRCNSIRREFLCMM
jgi:hypothetical protein